MGYLGVWLSYHPPSHNLERKSFYVTLLNGGKIGIYRGAMEHVSYTSTTHVRNKWDCRLLL